MKVDIITSSQNQFVKLARSLSQKKYRFETGLILVEGINLLRDMPASVDVRYVFFTADRQEEAATLIDKFGLSMNDSRVLAVTDSVMKTFADTVTPYGVAAIVKMPDVTFKEPSGKAVLLDAVADPGNVGTIIRTAAATGFDDVYLLDCAEVFSPKVIRATLGGIFRVRVHEIDLDAALRLVERHESAVLDMGGINILHADIASDVLLIAGNEAHGVRAEIEAKAKHIYALPMQNGIESLNVAIATSVAMYQTV